MWIETGTLPYTLEWVETGKGIENPNCHLCKDECDDNYKVIEKQPICTTCLNSEDTVCFYGSVENLLKQDAL